MGNKLHKQHKMYMANANQSLAYPIRTMFHWFVLELENNIDRDVNLRDPVFGLYIYFMPNILRIITDWMNF